MADFFTVIGDFLKPYLIQICTVVVGGMLIYEMLSGRAVVAGTRRITRAGIPSGIGSGSFFMGRLSQSWCSPGYQVLR
jgi:hypothetical protein